LSASRVLQLTIQLLNTTSSWIVYFTKLLFMSMGVLGLFVTIRYFTESPLLVGLVSIPQAAFGVMLYTFMYGAAFEIPHKLKVLKDKILLVAASEDV